jgi:hypothetical protein
MFPLQHNNNTDLTQLQLRLHFPPVDTNEEFTAFDTRILLEQSEYVNHAIRHILSMYHDVSHTPIKPTSVIIIGHSMGGIVSRQLFMMPNYLNGSINTIITLATPHLHPPVSFDRKMVDLYTHLNAFWSLRLKDNEQNSNREPNPLNDVMLLSISGGNRDTMIDSGSSEIESIVDNNKKHVFSVASTGMKNVWASSDHRCILWCNQLVLALVRGVYGMTDSASDSRTVPLKDRVKILSRGLRYEFGDEVALPSHSPSNQFVVQEYINLQASSDVTALSASNTPYAIKMPLTSQDTIKILIDGNSLPQRLGVCIMTSAGNLECSDIASMLLPLPKTVPNSADGAADSIFHYVELDSSKVGAKTHVVLQSNTVAYVDISEHNTPLMLPFSFYGRRYYLSIKFIQWLTQGIRQCCGSTVSNQG